MDVVRLAQMHGLVFLYILMIVPIVWIESIFVPTFNVYGSINTIFSQINYQTHDERKVSNYECYSDDIPRIDDFCLFQCVLQHMGELKNKGCRKLQMWWEFFWNESDALQTDEKLVKN